MKRVQAEPVRPPRADTHAPQGLDLWHLRYSAADADADTFTRASEPLFIAQPALSQQVRRLEQIVGTPLRRRRDGVRPTAAGTVLPDAARDGLSVVEHGVSQTRRRQAGVGRGSGLSTHHRSPVRVTAVTFGRRRRFW
jgi:DNA-binding transcriptional LysR family regulator